MKTKQIPYLVTKATLDDLCGADLELLIWECAKRLRRVAVAEVIEMIRLASKPSVLKILKEGLQITKEK